MDKLQHKDNGGKGGGGINSRFVEMIIFFGQCVSIRCKLMGYSTPARYSFMNDG